MTAAALGTQHRDGARGHADQPHEDMQARDGKEDRSAWRHGFKASSCANGRGTAAAPQTPTTEETPLRLPRWHVPKCSAKAAAYPRNVWYFAS